jgi:hypothetical protein
MFASLRLITLLGAILLSACSSTFTQTWKDPKATALEFKGQKVVAVVLIKDESTRRLAEDRLSQQIAARGVQGRAMYRMLPNATAGDEKTTRAALEAEGVKGVIVMRPVKVDRKVTVTENYEDQSYASFWGGYYGYGFALSYSTASNEPQVSEKTVVYVETLVYSLAQNKLVWGGKSKTTNPETLTTLIEELSEAATYELVKENLAKK